MRVHKKHIWFHTWPESFRNPSQKRAGPEPVPLCPPQKWGTDSHYRAPSAIPVLPFSDSRPVPSSLYPLRPSVHTPGPSPLVFQATVLLLSESPLRIPPRTLSSACILTHRQEKND